MNCSCLEVRGHRRGSLFLRVPWIVAKYTFSSIAIPTASLIPPLGRCVCLHRSRGGFPIIENFTPRLRWGQSSAGETGSGCKIHWHWTRRPLLQVPPPLPRPLSHSGEAFFFLSTILVTRFLDSADSHSSPSSPPLSRS